MNERLFGLYVGWGSESVFESSVRASSTLCPFLIKFESSNLFNYIFFLFLIFAKEEKAENRR